MFAEFVCVCPMVCKEKIVRVCLYESYRVFLSFTICIEFQKFFSYSNSKRNFFSEQHLHILLKRSDLLLVTNVKFALQLIDFFWETLSSNKTSQTLDI